MSDLELFNTVVSGPGSASYLAGATLAALGTVTSFWVNNLTYGIGDAPDQTYNILARAVIAMVCLAGFPWISQSIWWSGMAIAHTIYPASKMSQFNKTLAQVATLFQTYDLSLLSLARAAKDTSVTIVAIAAWVFALIGHAELEDLQVVAYDVIYVFGPLLIGLSCFNLKSIETWLKLLMEITSWSVIMAIVYFLIDYRLTEYLTTAQNDSLLSTHFLQVIQKLCFYASMVVVVPVLGGRLLGISGAFSGMAAGAAGIGVTAAIATFISKNMPNIGPSADPARGKSGSSNGDDKRRDPRD